MLQDSYSGHTPGKRGLKFSYSANTPITSTGPGTSTETSPTTEPATGSTTEFRITFEQNLNFFLTSETILNFDERHRRYQRRPLHTVQVAQTPPVIQLRRHLLKLEVKHFH